MITDSEKTKLKQDLGSQHISKITQFFIDNDIKNRNDAFYSNSFISRVFNGKVANEKVEAGIWRAADHYQDEKSEVRSIKDKVLKN